MRKVLFVLFLVLCPLMLQAQRCIMLTVSDGLSSSNVNALYQDSRGDIWIATENGLSRYDGLSVHTYKHDPSDPHSLAHNICRSFMEDGQGHLLVGGESGVQCYNPKTDDFSPLLTDEFGEPYTGNVNHMLAYSDQSVWLSGNDLLKVSGEAGGELVLTRLRLPIPTRMTGTLQLDADGTVWCARHGDGIYRISPGGFWSHYTPDIFEDRFVTISNPLDGVIYASDHSGNICHYDADKDAFVADTTPSLKGVAVFAILNAGDGRILFCTDGHGVQVLDRDTGEWSLLQFDTIPCDPATMNVHSILQDRDGNIWLAAYRRGVIMIPAETVAFHYLGSRSHVANVIGSMPVSSLLADRDGNLWVGTQGDGIYQLDAKLSLLKHYSVEEGYPSEVLDMAKDRDGNLWFASLTSGLWRLDTQRERLVNTAELNKGDRAVELPRSIAIDDFGRLWIGTMGYGLYCYDSAQGRTTRIETENESVNPRVSDVLIRGSNLYVATSKGIYHLDISASPLSVLHHVLPGTQVYCLESDGKNLYACTLNGLAILDLTTLDTTMVTETDGLPDNAVYSVEIGSEGELWLSTSSRLVRYNPRSRSVHQSDDDHLVTEFLRKVSAAGLDGRLYFGGTDGITYFKPSDIRVPPIQPHVKIVSFSVPGRRVLVDEQGYYTLNHTERTCTISFTTREFISMPGMQFSYSVNGGKWTTLDRGQTSVTLGNLHRGRYKISVKAAFGDQNAEPDTVLVRVRSPWWGSTLAICAYNLLGLILLCFVFYTARRMSQTRKKIASFEREQQARENKMRFFLSLSHEIRSPMTMVKAPLQKLIETDPDPERQRAYSIIERSADNVLHILDQTLAISKADEGAMKLSFAPVELVPYISAVCDLFRPQAEHNGQKLSFRYACSRDLEVWLDRDYFNKVVANLLSNALKYTPSGGSVSVTVSKGADTAAVEIKDTGCGMDEQTLKHVFDLFYQGKSAVSGSGIGLYFAKKITDLHHGTLQAVNNPDGTGSTFTVTLPLGNAHLSDEQLSEKDSPENYSMDLPVPHVSPQTMQADEHKRKKYTVLIVDDNGEIRNWLATEFAQSYRVLEAEDGKQAYSMALAERPDLLVSDVIMPGMDGFELCGKIRKNPNISSLPVILLTARTLDSDKIEGMEVGADAYITKPFNIDILKTTADNLIKGRERLKVTLSEPKVDESDIREVEIKTPDDRLLERIVRVVNEHLGDPELTVEQVAAEAGISRVHLHRKLKELTSQTPRDFIRNLRLAKAAEMLSEKKYAISELADAVGFPSASSFTTAFKGLYGVSPSEYGPLRRGV
ncbi:MAG: response regulator [Bacteroidales bacterium]|nr:response regulator [Bacteroidales bacterium]